MTFWTVIARCMLSLFEIAIGLVVGLLLAQRVPAEELAHWPTSGIACSAVGLFAVTMLLRTVLDRDRSPRRPGMGEGSP
ncbi:hypothetical protein LFM56_17370 [Cellulomonas iranensis]|uniref:hypothetical protein n=1 Tax=Cellulomonas iranensis TaxID=76862 RepID=UPI001CF2774A|nr:hypothetical protein [Cellulomonas iranensis]UCN14604.1 hypothetical protein LFM56_17370 [Cellulomonas iranensis]